MPLMTTMMRMIRGGGQRPGFLLLEALLGIAVFAIFIGGAYLTLLLGEEGSVAGGDRMRAVALAERALEAAENIRSMSFTTLAPGQYGIALGPGGTWVLSGSILRTSDGYDVTLTVTRLADNWIELRARAYWETDVGSSGSVALVTEFTDWRRAQGGDWSSITLVGRYTDAGTPLFNDVMISGNYAYVTSEVSDGGNGLYIFDVSNLASPTRVSSAFNLGSAGYGVTTAGTTLYLVVNANNDEVRSYDISAPTSFDSGDLRDTYNLPGNGLGRALTLNGSDLYVTAAEASQGGRDELYALNVTNPANITLRDSLDDTATFLDIDLSGTSAYLASSNDTLELRLADIENPANLRFVAGNGYNLTDVQDGRAVLAFGTGLVLGRANGAAIEEFVLFETERSPLPNPPPGPWYREMGNSVNALDIDITECAAFVGTDFDTKELQIVKVRDTTLPELTNYNSTSGPVRGLFYDRVRDRLFAVTNTELLIFQPRTGAPPC